MEISKEMFHTSRSWVKRNARPLECARWEYFFEGAPEENVVKYLSAFQNKDGGFGHGIEPDFWLPGSSPMATWAAGKILMEVGLERDEEIVQSMLTYLVETYQEESGMWEAVLPETNEYPHAPWWGWSKGVQENWMFNPGVELAAFLIYWSDDESEAARLGWASIEKAVNRLMQVDKMDMHELQNYQQMSKIMRAHAETFNRKVSYPLEEVIDKVLILIEDCMEKEAANWSTGYNPLPSDFIYGPEHPLFEKYEALVEENLNFYMEQVLDEGVWDLSWEWGSYPEEFPVARRNWKGILAVDRYKLFRSFGLIENI